MGTSLGLFSSAPGEHSCALLAKPSTKSSTSWTEDCRYRTSFLHTPELAPSLLTIMSLIGVMSKFAGILETNCSLNLPCSEVSKKRSHMNINNNEAKVQSSPNITSYTLTTATVTHIMRK